MTRLDRRSDGFSWARTFDLDDVLRSLWRPPVGGVIKHRDGAAALPKLIRPEPIV
jgi:hypothetical protein